MRRNDWENTFVLGVHRFALIYFANFQFSLRKEPWNFILIFENACHLVFQLGISTARNKNFSRKCSCIVASVSFSCSWESVMATLAGAPQSSQPSIWQNRRHFLRLRRERWDLSWHVQRFAGKKYTQDVWKCLYTKTVFACSKSQILSKK